MSIRDGIISALAIFGIPFLTFVLIEVRAKKRHRAWMAAHAEKMRKADEDHVAFLQMIKRMNYRVLYRHTDKADR